MTNEEMTAKLQEEYMFELLDMVDTLSRKINKFGYKPTEYEKATFNLIKKKINYMSKRFNY